MNDYDSPSQGSDWSNYKPSNQIEHTEEPASYRYFLPETTIYYGQDGEGDFDIEFVKMFFYTDGTCKIKEDIITESRECGGIYYVENSVIHITWNDNTNEVIDVSNGSFSRYGMTVSRIYV